MRSTLIKQYYDVKKQYYTIPKRYYIDLPRARSQVKMEYLRKVYIDRAYEVFLKQLVDWYHVYYELPRDELYAYLLRNNKNLATIWSKMHQTKKQLLGLPYESRTPSGAKCSCPSTKTPLKVIGQIASEDLDLAKGDVATAIAKTQQLYDKISEMRKKPSCANVDTIINNRNRIYMVIVLIILLFFLGL